MNTGALMQWLLFSSSGRGILIQQTIQEHTKMTCICIHKLPLLTLQGSHSLGGHCLGVLPGGVTTLSGTVWGGLWWAVAWLTNALQQLGDMDIFQGIQMLLLHNSPNTRYSHAYSCLGW